VHLKGIVAGDVVEVVEVVVVVGDVAQYYCLMACYMCTNVVKEFFVVAGAQVKVIYVSSQSDFF